jgi:hypothetical protein
MNKVSAAWLALRIIGLLALGRACLSLLSMAVDIVNLAKLYGVTYEHLAARTEQLILQTWVGLGVALAQATFFALVAFYFLRKGRAIHTLLMHEPAQ